MSLFYEIHWGGRTQVSYPVLDIHYWRCPHTLQAVAYLGVREKGTRPGHQLKRVYGVCVPAARATPWHCPCSSSQVHRHYVADVRATAGAVKTRLWQHRQWQKTVLNLQYNTPAPSNPPLRTLASPMLNSTYLPLHVLHLSCRVCPGHEQDKIQVCGARSA